MKIAQVSINPERKINLGNYDSATLSAGMVIVFDRPLNPDIPIERQQIQQAYAKARTLVREEFKLQYKPYKKTLIANTAQRLN